MVNIEKSGALATQVGGSHYKLAIQPIEYITANGLDFIQGNIVKYATRHKNKNKDIDIRKVIHYGLLSLQLDYGYSADKIDELLAGFMSKKEP